MTYYIIFLLSLLVLVFVCAVGRLGFALVFALLAPALAFEAGGVALEVDHGRLDARGQGRRGLVVVDAVRDGSEQQPRTGRDNCDRT